MFKSALNHRLVSPRTGNMNFYGVQRLPCTSAVFAIYADKCHVKETFHNFPNFERSLTTSEKLNGTLDLIDLHFNSRKPFINLTLASRAFVSSRTFIVTLTIFCSAFLGQVRPGHGR